MTNQGDLVHALRSRSPVEITLAAGEWGELRLSNISVPTGTVIRSDNVARPAVFNSIELRGVRGLAISGLAVEAPSFGDGKGRYGVLVINSRDLLIDKVSVRSRNRNRQIKSGIAMMLRQSSDVTVRQSYFTGFRHGIAMLDLQNSLIELNEFENLRTDAIRGGGVNRTRIANNVITGFTPAHGDHPDGIQLWSTGQRRTAKDVDIVDNLVVRGGGGPIQGIFVRDTRLRLPFEDLSITGNFIIGSLYNGITVLGARRLNLAANTVLAHSDQRSFIRMEYTRNSVAASNVAPNFVIRNNRTRPRVQGNRIIEAQDSNPRTAIRNWVESKTAFAEYRGAVLQRLMDKGQ